MSTIIRKGKKAIPAASSGKFLKIPEGEAVTVTILAGLEDLISVDQHAFWEINPVVIVPCIGEGCPACALGNKPKFKAFLPVLTKDEGPKIWPFGIMVLRQLESIEEETGTLAGQVVKIKKYGVGLATKYTVVALGRKVAIRDIEKPDIVEAIGPIDADGIREKLFEAGLIDDFDAEPISPAVVKKAAAKAAPAPEPAEDVDDDFNEDSDWESV